MRPIGLGISLLIGGALVAAPAQAQQAAEPAPPASGENIPPVDVVQQPKAAAQKKAAPAKKSPPKAAAKKAPSAPPPPAPIADAVPAETSPNASQYPPGGQGAAARAASGPTSPVSPTRGIVPGDLSTFAGSATRVTKTDLEEQRPQDNHEVLARVPGVQTVNDDGMARHSGIAVRGSAHRRSRKVLVMEDGVPINFSTYLDSSTHYTPPTQRIESVEVLRGPVVSYGPLNNHGIVNFRNLNPFGANETVIEGALGKTSGSDKNLNNYRHTHTRQNIGNVGVVASYSGGDAGGAWDLEELGYNDFFGALGFKGTNQDLTISGGYFRQRDRYDEDNFSGTVADFNRLRRNKLAGAAEGNFAAPFGYELSNYNADYYRLQVAHNLYLNQNTTISTRLFGNDHERARFYIAAEEDADPPETPVYPYMEGRDRRYRNYGADSRVEFANLPLFGGMKHDVQAGVRYEEHFFDNKNRIGATDEVLDWNNRGTLDGAPTKLEADSFAAFIQTAIHVTPTFTLTPGVRFETYNVSIDNPDEPETSGSADYNHVLPMLAFSWELMPKSALYGGYHRGLTPHIIRDFLDDAEAFSAPLDEVGDNFEVGLRTTAIRGLTLDGAIFHKNIENYQFGEAFQNDGGDRVFSVIDEAEFTGFEIYSRLDSRPFTGGPWNVFGEATYTYTDSEIVTGTNGDGDSVAGNAVPESIKHFAHLTLGIEHARGWDASVSYTHRGFYFVDVDNSPADPDDTEEGKVDDVWLLSARSNLKVTDNLTLFVSGQNLTNEFYVVDRADGAKPGVGRTYWGGFKLKF